MPALAQYRLQHQCKLGVTYCMSNPSLGCPVIQIGMQVEDAHIAKIWRCEVCLVRFHIVNDWEKRCVIDDDFAWTISYDRSFGPFYHVSEHQDPDL
jgi:hypothetical protein